MENTGIIYVLSHRKIGRTPEIKRYVGQTIQQFEERMEQHCLQVSLGSGYPFHNAIRKYGLDSFEKFLKKFPVSHLDYYEEAIIRKLDSYAPNGYNLTYGGGGRSIMRQDKISEVLSFWSSGYGVVEISYMVGCAPSTVTRILDRNNLTYEDRLDRWKLSRINGFALKAVVQIDIITRSIVGIFETLASAARSVGKNYVAISNCCRGMSKSSAGFLWKYCDEVSDIDLITGYYSGEVPITWGQDSGPTRKYDYEQIKSLKSSGLTCDEVALIVGCSRGTVWYATNVG